MSRPAGRGWATIWGSWSLAWMMPPAQVCGTALNDLGGRQADTPRCSGADPPTAARLLPPSLRWTAARVRVRGEAAPEWAFFLHDLGRGHWAAVARAPLGAVVDAWGVSLLLLLLAACLAPPASCAMTSSPALRLIHPLVLSSPAGLHSHPPAHGLHACRVAGAACGARAALQPADGGRPGARRPS